MLMKMQTIMKRKDNQKGFTIVELLIVMAILAVLAAVAVPKYTAVLAKSKMDAHNANIDMIVHAGQLYYDSNNQAAISDLATLVTAGYLKENPKDPISDTATAYTFVATAAGVYTVTPGLATMSGTAVSKAASATGNF